MAIKNLSIENFRGFRNFHIQDLGRANLFVGMNNCGKTTVLEAAHILMAGGDVSAIWATLSRRGEDIWVERDSSTTGSVRQVEIRRLFHGHEIEVGASFRLAAETDSGHVTATARIEEPRPVQRELFEPEPTQGESSDDLLPPLALTLSSSNSASKSLVIPISRRGGISIETVRRTPRSVQSDGPRIRFVTASSLTAEAVASLFDEIVLTPEEDLVTEALRLIEPSIERIASAGSERLRLTNRYVSRGGIFVRLKDVKDRIPIGSMGDGIWRMLGLALNVIHAGDGILFVDEIDTGLYHTVMTEMWSFLYAAAIKYNVQLLATTHSRDCYQSLAVICRDSVSDKSDVTIKRIETGRNEAVAYTEQEIIAAAERDIEVR